tara:strand:+ start:9333 stop:9494 length:162 start_codon:yes stop_codon:yes gene_type:complete
MANHCIRERGPGWGREQSHSRDAWQRSNTISLKVCNGVDADHTVSILRGLGID